MRNYIIYTLVFLSVVSCTKSYTPEVYGKWLNDPKNELVKYTDISGYRVSMQYRPGCFIAGQEVVNQVIAKTDFTKRNEELNEQYTFVLRFTSLVGKDPIKQAAGEESEYEKVSNFLAYEYGGNIACSLDDVLLPLADVQFVNYFGVSPYVEFIITVGGAPRLDFNAITLKVNDVFFTQVNPEFTFTKTQLTNVPKLKL